MPKNSLVQSTLKRLATTPLLTAWLIACVGLVVIAIFFLTHPQVFPMHGFSGPAEWRAETPAGIRFTGDSWRYIEGGEKIIDGRPFDKTQKSYMGYIAVTAASLSCGHTLFPLIALQIIMACIACAAVMNAAFEANAAHRFAFHAAVATGLLFALNPEFSAWHTAVMTESLYTSVVCVIAWLAVWATERKTAVRLPEIFALTFLTAFIRPTGWILLPAVAIYWAVNLLKSVWSKLVAVVCVIAIFLTMAFAGRSFNEGIQKESPSVKLYTGEVVWQEDLWRVKMPPADLAKTDLTSGLIYGIRHPVASAWLVVKRLAVMFLRIRPSYSWKHNLFLLVYHVPLTLLAFIGAWLGWKSRHVRMATAFVIAHAVVVALTFNDNDGRFTLYFTPLLGLLAATAVAAAVDRLKIASNHL